MKYRIKRRRLYSTIMDIFEVDAESLEEANEKAREEEARRDQARKMSKGLRNHDSN